MHQSSSPTFRFVEPLEARIAPAAVVSVDLAELDGSTGVMIPQPTSFSGYGRSFSPAGDVNGDGNLDFMFAATGRRAAPGDVFVVFGKEGGLEPNFDLTTLDGTNGFRIATNELFLGLGRSLSAADLNNDGFTDLVVGAPLSDEGAGYGAQRGAVYVVYGKASAFNAVLMTAEITGEVGLRISGTANSDRTGTSVSTGDINGDGLPDIVIGAEGVDTGATEGGAAYVVFGSTEALPSLIPVASLNGTNGFTLLGSVANRLVGSAIDASGDVNGDGFDDIVIGSSQTPIGLEGRGAVHVVFGKGEPFTASSSLGDLDGTNGFTVLGVADGDRLGEAVAFAGDINGDGIDDIVLGAPGADLSGTDVGTAYVIFGLTEGFEANFALSALTGESGFQLFGEYDHAQTGFSLSRGGDVNGDGLYDLLIAAPGLGKDRGNAYVLYGSTDLDRERVALGSLEGHDGFGIHHSSTSLNSIGVGVRSAGDLNGDGFDDLLIGESNIAVYVVYGFSSADAPIPPFVTIAANGKSATFTDWDGDVVKIKSSKGKLDASQFVLSAPNSETGGSRLLYADFTEATTGTEFTGTNLTFSAKKSANGGDGLVDVASLNATGTALGKVVVKGDLQELDASAVKKLTVQSFGRAGAADFYGDVGVDSAIAGGLGALEVKTIATGITISAETFGAMKLQDVDGVTVLAAGKANPTKTAEAVAIKSITAGGTVENSQFLAGYNADRVAVNADVQIGKVLVKGQWRASDLIAGVTAGLDGFFGSGDGNEGLIAGGGEIIARIAGITIQGGVFGSDSWGDAHAFSAEEIASLKVTGGNVSLQKGASNDSDLLLAGTTDVWLREV